MTSDYDLRQAVADAGIDCSGWQTKTDGDGDSFQQCDLDPMHYISGVRAASASAAARKTARSQFTARCLDRSLIDATEEQRHSWVADPTASCCWAGGPSRARCRR
jgi:hypothetical protein